MNNSKFFKALRWMRRHKKLILFVIIMILIAMVLISFVQDRKYNQDYLRTG